MNEIEEQIKRTKRELEQESHNIARLKNHESCYENGERQKCAHSLISQVAAVESLAPTVKEMVKDEFYELAEKIFDLPEMKKLVSEVK